MDTHKFIHIKTTIHNCLKRVDCFFRHISLTWFIRLSPGSHGKNYDFNMSSYDFPVPKTIHCFQDVPATPLQQRYTARRAGQKTRPKRSEASLRRTENSEGMGIWYILVLLKSVHIVSCNTGMVLV